MFTMCTLSCGLPEASLSLCHRLRRRRIAASQTDSLHDGFAIRLSSFSSALKIALFLLCTSYVYLLHPFLEHLDRAWSKVRQDCKFVVLSAAIFDEWTLS